MMADLISDYGKTADEGRGAAALKAGQGGPSTARKTTTKASRPPRPKG